MVRGLGSPAAALSLSHDSVMFNNSADASFGQTSVAVLEHCQLRLLALLVLERSNSTVDGWFAVGSSGSSRSAN